MNKTKERKGFTLVELIVVIVIIGILAAVLVPSLTGYITKAKRSNDVQVAGQLSREIQYYCIENGINQKNLIGTDVRTISQFRGYDLKPRTDKWTYVYNQTTQQVEVKDFPLFEGDGSIVKTAWTEPSDPSNYAEGFFLLGKGKSNFEQAVDILCTLTKISDYDEAVALVSNQALTHIQKFNPETTLYVSNSVESFTNSSDIINRIVYTEKTVSLPEKLNLKNALTPQGNALEFKSAIIKSIEKNSEFKNLYPTIKEINAFELKKIMITIDENDSSANAKNFGHISYEITKDFMEAKSQVIDVYGKTGHIEEFDGKYYFVTPMKVVMTLYGENGAFARGEVYYFARDYLKDAPAL